MTVVFTSHAKARLAERAHMGLNVGYKFARKAFKKEDENANNSPILKEYIQKNSDERATVCAYKHLMFVIVKEGQKLVVLTVMILKK